MGEKINDPERHETIDVPVPAYEMKDDNAQLVIYNDPKRGEIVQIRNERGGGWVELNNLLPEGYGFKFIEEDTPPTHRTKCDYRNKIIELQSRDFKKFTNWTALLVVLHEIAHAQNFQENPDSKRLIELISKEESKSVKKRYTLEFSKEFNQLMSINERNAWAGAIKMFYSLVKEIGVTPEELGLTAKEIEKFVNKGLSNQKELASMAEKDREGEEGDNLRQIISKLYTQKNN